MKRSLGRIIRDARAVSGMRQIDLGKRVGVSHPTVSYWERDEMIPLRSKLRPIAKALGVEFSELEATWDRSQETKQ